MVIYDIIVYIYLDEFMSYCEVAEITLMMVYN
jgi:hypothetical protein